ncbi:hypothetical protein Moror_14890 [Moniliophthora roreri MCA 2997]|uniref:DUF6533 domain-containing protein n=1 Tax=Moniliophthora roreri (strain MCA 2997) TaxID=1381753 RepID=V2W2Z7_MONRO|nr:hypothetical protein Moror_14890 [Moniliophthora roreri MCA 2997]
MSDYWCLFGITLLYWDHILTFPAEVKYIWRCPRRASSYIFFLNRYFTALTNVVVIISRLGPKAFLESSNCPAFQKVRDGIVVVAQVIVLFIMTMRIYALYACSKRVLWPLLCILIGGIAVSPFTLSYRPEQPELKARRCHTPRDERQAIQLAITWEAVFVYDTLVFLLAMYKAYQARRESQISIPLRNVIIRDGTLYFGAISLFSLANILTFYFAGPFMKAGISPVASRSPLRNTSLQAYAASTRERGYRRTSLSYGD